MKARSILESTHAALHFPLGEVRRHTGEPSPEVCALPYYDLVPKEPVDQLRWRLHVRERGAVDKEFRHAVLQACEEDILFFCNTLLWVFEPRRERYKTIPLNTWADQDDHIVWLDSCWGLRNCGTEKSRDLSLSWDHCIISYRHWYFDALSKIGFASLTEEKVDLPDDSDSLMWKLDFLHFNTPEWFRIHPADGKDILKRTYNDHRFHNRLNSSTINGYASTENLGRGGRKIAWIMDEFSEWNVNEQQRALDSTQYTTKCRYFPGTFSGDSDKFYHMMRVEKSTMLKIIADWTDNAWQRAGLYTSVGGHLKILDDKYVYPPDYPFILDGKRRSPYYDGKCKEPGATPQSIARELDRDPQGATSKVFAASVLEKARASCRAPYFVGNLDFTPGEYQPIWVNDPQGRMFVWKDMAKVEQYGRTTYKLGYGGPYAVGCDISTGAGTSDTSNSAIEVIDIASGEQVLELYSHVIRPTEFAQLAFVVCHWLCEGHDLSWAYLNFENQGIGEAFVKEIIRLQWAHCYYTQKETVLYKQRSEKVGYHNADGGYSALLELQRGIQMDETTIRSEKVVMECGQYEIGTAGKRAGKCIHVGSAASGDASAQGKAHGDCAVAYALAWMAARDRPVEKQPEITDDPDARLLLEIEEQLTKKHRGYILGGVSDGEEYIDFRNAS